MRKYLRFYLLSILLVGATIATLAGGAWLWLGFAFAVLLATGGDELFGDDESEPLYRHPWVLNVQLYVTLPLLLIYTLAYAWQLGPGDPFGFGAWVSSVTGIDLVARQAQTQWWHLLGGALGLGLFYGAGGTNVGHELTHRTGSRVAQTVGRWLLALTSDAAFAIEHVYGHHKNVATRKDPATARRGESAWAFLPRSTFGGWASAARIEAVRLRKRGHAVWSGRNRIIRGALMTVALAVLFGAVAGWVHIVTFLAISLYGKCYLEMVNYVEHYGMVRVEGRPVEPRHSWNCNRRVSSVLLFNLTRHSHHHAMGEKPFWELRAYPDSPMLPHGYLTMIFIAMVPPLWNRMMVPRVLAWDERYASEEERPLIEEANRESGLPAFEAESQASVEPASVGSRTRAAAH